MLSFLNQVVNLSSSFREDKLNDVECLVVPLSMISPGVLNGSLGEIHYTDEENQKSVSRWNNMPIVINHPEPKDGKAQSARTAEILNNSQIGVVLNTQNDGKLKAEAWIFKAKTEKLRPSILWNIYRGIPEEVSTGLGIEIVEQDGKKFATNYQPDHLAVLPDSKGACSLEDGCGLVVNQLSLGELRTMLIDKLRDKHPGGDNDIWIDEDHLFNTKVIYYFNGKLLQQRYKKLRNDVQLIGMSKPVEKVITFKPLNERPEGKEDEMDKDELVQSIINSSCNCWDAEDEDVLNGFSKDKLQKIHDGIVSNETKNKETEEAVKIANAVKESDQIVINDDGRLQIKEKKTEPSTPRLTDEEKEDLEFARNEKNRRREVIINRLLKDKKDDAKIEAGKVYETMTLNQLEAIDPGEVKLNDYSGNGNPVPASNEDRQKEQEEGMYTPAPLNWD